MEKIMSKTNDNTLKLGHATFEDHGALADTELKLVDKATPKLF
jgi:hypothetical protein